MDVEVKPLLVALNRAVKTGEPVRFSECRPGVLEIVAVGIDCRVASYVRALSAAGEGSQLPVSYVQAASLAKALQIRATDKLVKLRVDETHMHVRHGAYRMKLPLVQDDFEMAVPASDLMPFPGGGFEERLNQVAPIVDKTERQGVLMQWGSERVALVSRAGTRQVHIASWDCEVGASSGRLCFSKGAADGILQLGEIQSWRESGGSLFFEGEDAALRVSPIRDGYPTDYYAALSNDSFDLVCSFRRDELIFAVKAAAAVLSKNDIDVSIESTQVVKEQEVVVFRVRAQNGVTQATAEEAVMGGSTEPQAWKGRVNAKDLLASLARFGSNDVTASFGKKMVRLHDPTLRAFLLLLG